MTRKEKLRRVLLWVFWVSLAFTAAFTWIYVKFAVPDQLNLVAEEEEIFHFSLPPGFSFESESEEVVLGNGSNIPEGQVRIQEQKAESVSMYGASEGSYRIGMKFLGIFPMKEIQVDVVEDMYAVPCGMPVGIYLRSDGVMVIGTGQITNEAGNVVEPAYGVLKSGDYIEEVNGEALEDKDELIEAVNASDGKTVRLSVRRGGELVDVDVRPVLAEDGSYKLGAWVRDDTQGIGTMTYVDANGSFGALGHGISDSDTGELVETGQGSLYTTQIMGIEKGSVGSPGLLSGVIYYGPQSKMGDIEKNTSEGIFGMVNEAFMEKIQGDPVEVARRQDVKQGTAYIRSSISGETRDYAIEIQKVDFNASHKNKSMVIKVTDPALLELTGGIVQGMSGSPILQDGKLVGAVTHVFVQDAARGYGILAEDMILN